MADVQPMVDRSRPPPRTTLHGDGSAQFLQRIRHHAPNSTQLLGILTLVVSVGVLFMLGCISATAATIGLILFSPIIVLSTPIWLPIGTVLFLLIASFLVFCSVAVASVALGSWLYRYFKGLHPPGSDRVDYARSRIADTASHVKDYAREYGGYIQSKVKDAAPGA